MARAPPTIDFAAALSGNETQERDLVNQVRDACTEFGFFQLVNHGVPRELQQDILDQAREFFDLPLADKEKYNKDADAFNRGYETLRAQNFEKRTQGDLKEGFYLGKDLPADDPGVVARKFGQGPNKYPAEVAHPDVFKTVMDRYHQELTGLACKILRILAKSLDLQGDHFLSFQQDPVAILRLLHYPPQPPDASALERGIGAHTDFGALTILLQDTVGGLQIWDRAASAWADVVPVEGAFVINLGNLMMRWTNDKYLSNLHRVINKSGRERYSVPFFFSGNPDFRVQCLPSCEDEGQGGAKYPPITVGEWMTGRYADTYGKETGALAELSAKQAADGMACAA